MTKCYSLNNARLEFNIDQMHYSKKYIHLGLAVLAINSAHAVTVLNFGSSVASSTLINGATNAAGGEIRWAGIATVNGGSIDLIATVSGGEYQANNTANNGLNGQLGQVNVQHSTSVEFTFTIVETGTTNAVVAQQWDFAFFDLDTATGGTNVESLSVVDTGSLATYTITTASELAVGGSTPEPTFTATTFGTGPDNPTDPTDLTAQQENRSILFTLKDTSSFVMNYDTTSGSSGRNFLFAGEAIFDDVPVTVVSVPEPSSSALLLGAGLLAATRRKRK